MASLTLLAVVTNTGCARCQFTKSITNHDAVEIGVPQCADGVGVGTNHQFATADTPVYDRGQRYGVFVLDRVAHDGEERRGGGFGHQSSGSR